MATPTRPVVLAACFVLAACRGAPAATVRPTIATPSPEATSAPVTGGPPPSEIPMQTSEATPAGELTLTSSSFSEGGTIPQGAPVRVRRVDGVRLIVGPESSSGRRES